MESNEYLNNRDLESIHRELTELKQEVREMREAQGDSIDRLQRDNIYVRGFLGALLFFLGIPAVVSSAVGAWWLLKLISGH